jgi:hypothetical protein
VKLRPARANEDDPLWNKRALRVVVRNQAASRGMTMLPSAGLRRVLAVKHRMPSRVIPSHLEERRRRREFEENGGAGKRPNPL